MPQHNHTASSSSAGNHKHRSGVAIKINHDDTPAYSTEGYESASASKFAMYAGSSANALSVTSTTGSHSHTISVSNKGSGQSHNNIQPYYTVYCWRRSA